MAIPSSSIILASSSPRRKKLLTEVGIEFEAMHPDVEENYPHQLQTIKVPEYLAQMKAQYIYDRSQTDKIIVAADTLVFINDTIIGKPSSREEAIEILQRLSGKTHSVSTGVALLHQDRVCHFCETTKVEFYPLTLDEITFYIDTCKPYDKAGAYSINEWIGYYAIKSIQGDYNNVLGLPVSRLVHELRAFIHQISAS